MSELRDGLIELYHMVMREYPELQDQPEMQTAKDLMRSTYWAGRDSPSQEWISVEERLPDFVRIFGERQRYKESTLVLIVNDGAIRTGWRETSGWSSYGGDILRAVTHWMPVPEGLQASARKSPVHTFKPKQNEQDICDLCGMSCYFHSAHAPAQKEK